MEIANAFGYNQRSEVTEATMGTNSYGYVYDPIGDQKSAKPKAEPQGDRDFEAVRQRGARSGIPRRSGNCNRLTAAANIATNVYASNPLNQYTNIAGGSVYSPAYDADGNMLTNGVWAFVWDGENRLVSACSNGVLLVSNAYDHRSRRIRKEVSVWDPQLAAYRSQSTASFLWDNWNIIRETVAIGNTQSAVTNYYTWGVDLSGSLQGAGGVGGLLSVTTTDTNSGMSTNYYPVYDANGNVTAYLDAGGAAAARYEYDAFGNTVSESGSLSDAFTYRFSTKLVDVETGLIMYQLRPYSPPLGRWLSRDPIGEEDSALPNLHNMVSNDPMDSYDAFGLFGAGRRYVGGEWKWVVRSPVGGSKHPRVVRVRVRVPKGHSDFPEYSEFDYVKQDTEWETSPWPLIGDPASHFESKQQVEGELNRIFKTCGKGSFESAMHKGQDVFTHWNKYYRWDPFNFDERDWGLGHGPDSLLGINPDADDEAFEQAREWTSGKLNKWHENCVKCNGTWRHRL